MGLQSLRNMAATAATATRQRVVRGAASSKKAASFVGQATANRAGMLKKKLSFYGKHRTESDPGKTAHPSYRNEPPLQYQTEPSGTKRRSRRREKDGSSSTSSSSRRRERGESTSRSRSSRESSRPRSESGRDRSKRSERSASRQVKEGERSARSASRR